MNLKKIQETDVTDKKILVRFDLDVPLSDTGNILDDTRLKASLETLQFLLEKNAQIIIIGHLGRPKGTVVPAMSLAPVAKWYAEYGKWQMVNGKWDDFNGWKLSEQVTVLENLRFYPGEEANDVGFAKELARLGDIYVDDAFAVSHRSAASNVGITQFLPSFAGMQLQKEITGLSKVLDNPVRPLVVIIGGAKLETKLPMVSKMHDLADTILVGGKLITEKELLDKEMAIQKKAAIIVATPAENGLDISKESSDQFVKVIQEGKTIVWNGPVGKTDGDPQAIEGTKAIADAMSIVSGYTVIGGGDTIEFLDREKMLDKFSFVSTGGGAMLAFLSGEILPALTPLLSSA